MSDGAWPDAHAGVVGTTWKRREPQGDGWDRLTIVGLYDLGERNGGVEVVLAPTDGFDSPLSASAESLTEHYEQSPDEAPVNVRRAVENFARG